MRRTHIAPINECCISCANNSALPSACHMPTTWVTLVVNHPARNWNATHRIRVLFCWQGWAAGGWTVVVQAAHMRQDPILWMRERGE